MKDRARKTDATRADAQCCKPRTLDELMADVPVIKSWDDLAIPDLTDEEAEAFAAALDEDRALGGAAQIEAAARAVVEADSELYPAAPRETSDRFEQAMGRLRAALET